MRVLIATREYPPFSVGGISKHTFYLATYLKKKGVRVLVVSFGDPKLSNDEVLFVKPKSSIIARKHGNLAEDVKIPLDIARFTAYVKSILRSGDYDILHVTEPYVGGLIPYDYKVTTIHHTGFGEIRVHLRYRESEIIERLIFYTTIGYVMEFASIATSRVIITPSPASLWELTKVYRVPLKKLRFIPNGVEEPLPDEPDKMSARRILKIPEDCFIVFTTAYHVARKRLETLIKATKIVKDKGHRNMLIIVGGEGPLTKFLIKLATNLGVQDIVRFTGWIPDDKLPLYYRASDVFVVTSEYEGGPLTMLEAGIRGIPLVVTDVPSGLMMLARNGVDCLKFKLGDANDLAEKLIILSSNYELWRKLSVGAKTFASMFRWERIIDKILSVYREVLSFG